MKKQIWESAKERLTEIYGEKVPLMILDRFEYERLTIGNHNIILWYDFLGKLRNYLQGKGERVKLRGETSISVVSWILGATTVNPLPPHYYCPVCKKVEFISEVEDGYDLPKKQCECGTEFIRDGHNISMNSAHLLKGPYFAVEISNEMESVVDAFLKDYFKDYANVVKVEIEELKQREPESNELSYYIIFDKSNANQHPTGIWQTNLYEYYKALEANQGISFTLCDGQTRLSTVNRSMLNYSRKANKEKLKTIISWDKDTYARDGSSFEEYVDSLENISFYELVKIAGLFLGTGTWDDDVEQLLKSGIPLKDIICNREDVYDYLNDKIAKRCGESAKGLAVAITENVRKGRYRKRGIPVEIRDILTQVDVPEWYMDRMENIMFLSSKVHIISVLQSM